MARPKGSKNALRTKKANIDYMQTDEILRISPYRDGFITCSKEGIYGAKQHAFPKRRKKIIYSWTVKMQKSFL